MALRFLVFFSLLTNFSTQAETHETRKQRLMANEDEQIRSQLADLLKAAKTRVRPETCMLTDEPIPVTDDDNEAPPTEQSIDLGRLADWLLSALPNSALKCEKKKPCLNSLSTEEIKELAIQALERKVKKDLHEIHDLEIEKLASRKQDSGLFPLPDQASNLEKILTDGFRSLPSVKAAREKWSRSEYSLAEDLSEIKNAVDSAKTKLEDLEGKVAMAGESAKDRTLRAELERKVREGEEKIEIILPARNIAMAKLSFFENEGHLDPLSPEMGLSTQKDILDWYKKNAATIGELKKLDAQSTREYALSRDIAEKKEALEARTQKYLEDLTLFIALFANERKDRLTPVIALSPDRSFPVTWGFYTPRSTDEKATGGKTVVYHHPEENPTHREIIKGFYEAASWKGGNFRKFMNCALNSAYSQNATQGLKDLIDQTKPLLNFKKGKPKPLPMTTTL